ncbi:MAG: recombination protein NinG [Marinifilaceae bacterium]
MANKRKCPNCGEYNHVCDGVMIKNRLYCNMGCAIKYARDSAPKAKAKLITQRAKETRKAKKKNKDNDHKHQFKLTKEVIQRWCCKVRDADLPCISCGNTNPSIVYAGGHYKTAGGHPELALNTLNIHRQCNVTCNKFKSGNIAGDKHSVGYREGLIERYDQAFVDNLESYHVPVKLTCDQLRELRAYYAKLTREGKKTDEDRPF